MSRADDTIALGHRMVGRAHPPLVIAEMSGNHNGSLERALALVEAAAAAGAHALKLQTYTADTMTLDIRDREFLIDDPSCPWRGSTLYELYQKAHTPWDWHPAIFERCAQLGMVGFSTPFDATAVSFLEQLGVPCYKIASFENTDLPLIRRVASTGKPVLISTGMATREELNEAVQAARDAGCRDLILLRCTSSYPAPAADSDLRTIPDMMDRYGCQAGLSDHTMGSGVAVASVALGATVIEKHFTLRRADGGVDAEFSLEPGELAALVRDVEQAWVSLGTVRYGPGRSERASLAHRRSLYVTRDLRAGDVLTAESLRAIRPGNGLPPRDYDSLLGRTVVRDVPCGTPASWDLVGGR